MPRDITVTFSDGSTHVYKGAPDDVTPEQAVERAKQDFGKDVKALDGGRQPAAPKPQDNLLETINRFKVDDPERTAKVAGSAALRGGLSLPALFAGGATMIPQMAGLTSLVKGLWKPGASGIPLPQPLAPLEAVATLGTQPETPGEKYLASGVEGVTAALTSPGPGGAFLKTLTGAGSGVGGEAAAQVTGSDNPLIRIVGALLGGAAPTAIGKVVPNAEKLVRDATSQVSDLDFAKAKSMSGTLQEHNVPFLWSQLLGKSSTLDDVVADAAANPRVRPSILNRVERVSPRSKAALERWQTETLPPAVNSTRETLGDVQEIAGKSIRSLEGQANKAFTAALPSGGAYEADYVREVAKRLREAADDPNYFAKDMAGSNFLKSAAAKVEAQISKSDLVDAAGNRLDLPVDQRYVNNVAKELNLLAEQSGLKGQPLAQAKAIIKSATPEFDPARAAKAEAIATQVNPVKKGLAGDLARIGGGTRPDRYTMSDQAIARVFPKDKAQPAEIRQLIKDIGLDETSELFREHLSRAMQRNLKLAQDAAEGARQPAKLVQELFGTAAQRQNTSAMLDALSKQHGANSRLVKQGFYKLLRALQSTKDIKIPGSIDKASLQLKAGESAAGMAVAPMSRVSRSIYNRVTEKTYRKIADMVLSPDGLKEIEKIARSESPGYARAYVMSVLATANEAEADNTPPITAP